MEKRLVLASAAVAVTALSVFAQPRKAADFTVSGYTGESALANFPVLVRISPERISGFSYADCAADGADIAFTDANGNALAREIDTWDTAGESLVWVRVPSLANGTVITMTYADSSVTASKRRLKRQACAGGAIATPGVHIRFTICSRVWRASGPLRMVFRRWKLHRSLAD